MEPKSLDEIQHPYRAADENYHSPARTVYKSWASFYEDFGNSDVDQNLVVRWDVRIVQAHESARPVRTCFLSMIHQRTGLFRPIEIHNFHKEEDFRLLVYLGPHWVTLVAMWVLPESRDRMLED